jgi:hypothetical protein
VVVGRDPRTALGRALGRLATAPHDVGVDVVGEPAAGRALVVGAGTAGPLAIAERAAEGGWPVLLEPFAAGGAPRLTDLAAATSASPGAIVPALRRRHEPDARWAQGAVGRGAVGLPWGVHAESLEGRAPDALTDALDLVDALERVASVRLSSAVPIAVDSSIVLASIAFEDGVIGQVAARVALHAPDGPERAEMASLRVTGSHGTVIADLDAPSIEASGVATDPSVRRSRLGPDGAERLLASFLATEGRPDGAGLATLADAARILAILAAPPRVATEG